jgi:hypothetical protein
MTGPSWISTRSPVPPAALTERLREVIGRDEPVADRRARALLDASLVLLDTVMERAETSRSGALSLLAADALITYAFEAAADDPGSIVPLATEAMERIAAVTASGRP